MSDLTRDELRDIRMRAADAQRLLNDPTLWDVLRTIRAQAVNTTIYGPDERDRAQGRGLCVAIDLLATELQSRIDTSINADEVQRRAKGFE